MKERFIQNLERIYNDPNFYILAIFKMSGTIAQKDGTHLRNVIANIKAVERKDVEILYNENKWDRFLYELCLLNIRNVNIIHFDKLDNYQELFISQNYDIETKTIFKKFTLPIEVNNGHPKYHYIYTNIETILNKDIWNNPGGIPFPESILFDGSSLLIFNNMTYKEIITYFRQAGYIISGGNVTGRHILTIERQILSSYWFAMAKASHASALAARSFQKYSSLEKLYLKKDRLFKSLLYPGVNFMDPQNQNLNSIDLMTVESLKENANKLLADLVLKYFTNIKIYSKIINDTPDVNSLDVKDLLNHLDNETISAKKRLDEVTSYKELLLSDSSVGNTLIEMLKSIVNQASQETQDACTGVHSLPSRQPQGLSWPAKADEDVGTALASRTAIRRPADGKPEADGVADDIKISDNKVNNPKKKAPGASYHTLCNLATLAPASAPKRPD